MKNNASGFGLFLSDGTKTSIKEGDSIYLSKEKGDSQIGFSRRGSPIRFSDKDNKKCVRKLTEYQFFIFAEIIADVLQLSARKIRDDEQITSYEFVKE